METDGDCSLTEVVDGGCVEILVFNRLILGLVPAREFNFVEMIFRFGDNKDTKGSLATTD